MFSLQKYHAVKKAALLFPFLLFSVLLYAQYEEETDSTAVINEIDVSDSLVQPLPETKTDVYEGYRDEPVVRGSVYFLSKYLQENGGGPDSLRVRELPDTLTRRLKLDEDFWYVDYEFEKKKKKEKKDDRPFMESPFFQTLLWLIIIGGFAAFVILYLSNSNVKLFRKKSVALGPGGDGYAETDNIFEINYQREIEKAVNSGNYRLAVRLLFLQTLKNLSDRKVIDYKQDRTNFDYLAQIHSSKYYPDFFRLTLNYEYSWYGQFDIDAEKFAIIKNEFENFDRNLK